MMSEKGLKKCEMRKKTANNEYKVMEAFSRPRFIFGTLGLMPERIKK